MLVKICGLTRAADAEAAAEAGADAVGFVFAPSPRRITPDLARTLGAVLPAGILRVGIFVDPDPAVLDGIMAEARLDLVQIHGYLPATDWLRLGGRAIRGVKVGRDEPLPGLSLGRPRFLLLDSYKPGIDGGTGTTFPWELAEAYRRLGRPLLLSGGLKPGNVRDALDAVAPAGVDVSSGVETAPGIKDKKLMVAFVHAVRDWEEKHP